MNSHLTLDGRWVRCRAVERACPRLHHLPGTTPAEAKQLPMSFLLPLFEVMDPPSYNPFGDKVWLDQFGRLHRDHDLPASIDSTGYMAWYVRGSLDRPDDKPATVYPDGSCMWYRAGERHREEGKPAVVSANGYTAWYQHGRLHREDGPAVIHPDGRQEFYLQDTAVSSEAYGTALLKLDTDAYLRWVGRA